MITFQHLLPVQGDAIELRILAHQAAQYVIAASLVVLVGLACIPLAPIIGYRAVSLVLLMVILLLPFKFGRSQVFLASGVAALAWNFLFIPPLYTFAIGVVEDAMYWTIFFVVATVSGSLAGLLRAREQHARALFALTKDLSSAHSQQEVLQAAASHISSVFQVEIAVFLGEPDGDIMPKTHPVSTWFPGESESQVAAWAYWNERKAGRATDRNKNAEGMYLPMSGPRYPIGVVGIRPRVDRSSSLRDIPLLENFVAQIGLACERELLNELNQRAIVVEESERLYRTLFNSISHELRTPLAAILGASENLEGRVDPPLDPLARLHTTEIRRAAERLDRLVANLLDMSRLESGFLQPKADWTDLRDVVAGALRELEKDLATRRLSVTLPESLPLMKLDFGLLQQAVFNIIHNSIVHAPATAEIKICARVEGQACVLCIADNGPGIPAHELRKVFEKFYRSRSTTSAGTGLGLPIAKGFVEAQRGTISLQNRVGGGVECVITLPLVQNTIQP
jgi:two-component system sensor histidine kinase KdpD